jgi:hypothetical protein
MLIPWLPYNKHERTAVCHPQSSPPLVSSDPKHGAKQFNTFVQIHTQRIDDAEFPQHYGCILHRWWTTSGTFFALGGFIYLAGHWVIAKKIPYVSLDILISISIEMVEVQKSVPSCCHRPALRWRFQIPRYMSNYHVHSPLYSTHLRNPLILPTDVRLLLKEVIETIYHNLAVGLGSGPLNN